MNASKAAPKARAKKTERRAAPRTKPNSVQPKRVTRPSLFDDASPALRLGDKVYAAVLDGIMDGSFAVGSRQKPL